MSIYKMAIGNRWMSAIMANLCDYIKEGNIDRVHRSVAKLQGYAFALADNKVISTAESFELFDEVDRLAMVWYKQCYKNVPR